MTSPDNPYDQQKSEQPLSQEQLQVLDGERQQRGLANRERSLRSSEATMRHLSVDRIIQAGGPKFKKGIEAKFLGELDALSMPQTESKEAPKQSEKVVFSAQYRFVKGRPFLIGPKGALVVQETNTSPEAQERLKQSEKLQVFGEFISLWLDTAQKHLSEIGWVGKFSKTDEFIKLSITDVERRFAVVEKKARSGKMPTEEELKDIFRAIEQTGKDILGFTSGVLVPLTSPSTIQKLADILFSDIPHSKDQKILDLYRIFRGKREDIASSDASVFILSEGVQARLAQKLVHSEGFEQAENMMANDSKMFSILATKLLSNRSGEKEVQIRQLEKLGVWKNLAKKLIEAYDKTEQMLSESREKNMEELKKHDPTLNEKQLNDLLRVNERITLMQLTQTILAEGLTYATIYNKRNDSKFLSRPDIALYGEMSGAGDRLTFSDQTLERIAQGAQSVALGTIAVLCGNVAMTGALRLTALGVGVESTTELALVTRAIIGGFAFGVGAGTAHEVLQGRNLGDFAKNIFDWKELTKSIAFMAVIHELSTLGKVWNEYKGLSVKSVMPVSLTTKLAKEAGRIAIGAGIITGVSQGLEFSFGNGLHPTLEEYIQALVLVGTLPHIEGKMNRIVFTNGEKGGDIRVSVTKILPKAPAVEKRGKPDTIGTGSNESLPQDRTMSPDTQTIPEPNPELTRILNGEVYQRYPYLKEYVELLGELKPSDVIGEGGNGIIISSPKQKAVLKFSYGGPEKVLMLQREVKNHDLFYTTLANGKREGVIPNYVKIPRIFKATVSTDAYFSMERVDGHSLRSFHILKTFRESLSPEEIKSCMTMTDRQIEDYIAKKMGVDRDMILMECDNLALSDLAELFPDKLSGVQTALSYLEQNGLKHTDLHNGNIMVGRDGSVYLIDFGIIQSQKKQ